MLAAHLTCSSCCLSSSTLWTVLLDDVDFNYYHDTIVSLLDEYANHCSPLTGYMSYVHLLEMMHKRMATVRIERLLADIECFLPTIKTMRINRLDFMTIIPLMIYLQSSSNDEQVLFRFRDHSLIDLYRSK
jgi:hypothetical protein